MLFRVEPGHGDTVVESTDTDRAGRFRIPPVPPGAYLLDVRADGFDTLRYAFQLSGARRRPGAPPRSERPGPERRPDAHDLRLRADGAAGRRRHQHQHADGQGDPGAARRDDPLAQRRHRHPAWNHPRRLRRHPRPRELRRPRRCASTTSPCRRRCRTGCNSCSAARSSIAPTSSSAGCRPSSRAPPAWSTSRPAAPARGPTAQLLLAYGTYNALDGQAFGAGRFGPLSVVAAGSIGTTERGLDPPAATPDPPRSPARRPRLPERRRSPRRRRSPAAAGRLRREPLPDPH